MTKSDDYIRYEQLLEETVDSEGINHRDIAVKLFVEELVVEEDRVLEFAEARAQQVADRFAKTRQPEVESGQMRLTEDDYLVLGDSEIVRVTVAKAVHTRQWIDNLDRNHARVSAAWSAKTMHARRIAEIQDEQDCSMWDAEQILLNVSPSGTAA